MRRRGLVLGLGGVMTASGGLRAQPMAMPVVGYLSATSSGTFAPRLAAFRQGLAENGFVEGQNMAIEFRRAEGRFERLPALAVDLIARKVDVIVAPGGVDALAAKSATSTIPIVFLSSDAVERGLVDSLARPGGNLTGVGFLNAELMAKRFELLSELVPQAGVIALLVNPNAPATERIVRDVQEASRTRRVRLIILKAGIEGDIDAAFATLAQHHVGALVMGADGFLDGRRQQVVALAAFHAVPTIYEWRETVQIGGLISYGSDITAAFRQIGVYVGKVLRGAKPADLPVERSTKFELVINLKTVKALGLTIPSSFAARIDEVIE